METTNDKLDRLIRLTTIHIKLTLDIQMDIATLKQQVTDLQAKADANAAIDAQAIGLLQALNASVADLKAQLAAGAAVTAADLQALSDALTGVSTTIDKSNTAEAAAIAANTPAP